MKQYDYKLYKEILVYYDNRNKLRTKVQKSVKMDKETLQTNGSELTQ